MLPDAHDTVTFFFDPVSPYAWLASKEIGRLQDMGLAVDYRPVLFAGLLNAHGQKGPAEIPAKRAYTFRDVLRLAAQRGYTFGGPPAHPFNPLRALRMCIALDRLEERNRFAQETLDATWERGDNLSDPIVLQNIASACGLEKRELTAAAEKPEIKERLVAATRAAVEAGVFGVPTFKFNDELFWGGDRIDALIWRSKGNAIDEKKLQDFLQRSASAQRKSA